MDGVYKMDLSKRLKEYRENAGLTQAELARAVKVSRAAVSRWEQGEAHTMTLKYAQKASVAMGVSVNELAGGKQAVHVLNPEALEIAVRSVENVFKQVAPDKKARVIAMVYQLVAQGTDVPESLVAQLGSLKIG